MSAFHFCFYLSFPATPAMQFITLTSGLISQFPAACSRLAAFNSFTNFAVVLFWSPVDFLRGTVSLLLFPHLMSELLFYWFHVLAVLEHEVLGRVSCSSSSVLFPSRARPLSFQHRGPICFSAFAVECLLGCCAVAHFSQAGTSLPQLNTVLFALTERVWLSPSYCGDRAEDRNAIGRTWGSRTMFLSPGSLLLLCLWQKSGSRSGFGAFDENIWISVL